MNKNLHRLVFSRIRNKLMAVQETASSVGGGGGGETLEPQSATGAGRCGAGDLGVLAGNALRAVSWAAICTLGLSVLVPASAAQPAPGSSTAPLPLIASPTAPAGQRPIIDAAQNGVPIVHIAPPTAGGVSRNQFQQFNVDRNGLILNNSSGNVLTQLGGWISANPQLGYVPARIIVNEVVGTGTTMLRGTIEVAGRKADVVISNPNGLFCDGCNFLNTARATLSTGTPQYDAQGTLKGFDVRQGLLTVGSGGLNATNLEQLDLIARGLVIEGEVWAQNLHALAGANQVLYASLGEIPAATAQTGTGNTPLFAIDLKDLGAMNANTTYLIATEKGVGVNSTGRIAALQGNLQLSVNGDLTLKDTYSTQDLHIDSAGNTSLTGQTQSGGSATIASGGSLTNIGTLDSTGVLSIQAGSVSNSGSVIGRATTANAATITVAAMLANTGTVYSAGDLNLNAQTLADSNGSLQAAGNLVATAQSVSLTGTQLATNGALTLAATAGDLATSGGQINTSGAASLTASGKIAQTQSILQSQTDIALNAESISNTDSTVLATGALNVSTPGQANNTGGKLMGSAAVTVNAGSLVNDASASNQALIASDHATIVTTTASGGVSNRGGVISGKTALAVQTNGAALTNAGGILVSNSALDINAGAIDSTGGQIVSRGQNGTALHIHAASLNNAGGVVNAAGALNLAITGAVSNTGDGSMQAGTATAADLVFSSASLVNDGGTLTASGNTQIATGAFSNNAGTVASNAATTITAGQASNKGGSIASGTGTTLSTQSLDNSGGSITSAAALAIDTHGQALANSAGQIGANGAVDVSSGTLSNAKGRIASANDRVGIISSSIDNTAATISAATSATVQSAGSVVNDQGVISGATSATIASMQAFSNRGGRVLANDAVSVTAASLDNTGGTVSAQHTSVDVGQGAINNTSGQLIGAATLSLANGALTNAKGTIVSGSDLNLDTHGQAFNNAGGTLQTTGPLTLHTAALDNSAGVVNSKTALAVTTTGALINVGGELSASKVAGNAASTGNVAIDTNGQGLATSGGRIVAEGDLNLKAGAVSSSTSAGVIAANHDATLAVASLANAGIVQAGNNLELTTSVALANAGAIKAGQDATITAASLTSIGTSAAPTSISAARDLGVSASSLTNQQSTLQAGHNLQANADTLANTSAGKLIAGGTLQIAGLTASTAHVNNASGLVSASGAVTVAATALTNDAGRIESGATTQIAAGATTNRAGVITSASGTTLNTQALDSSKGEISSAAALAIDTHGQALVNQGGKIVAAQGLTLNAGALDNSASGVIGSSSGNVNLAAASLINDAGSISAKQAVTAVVAGSASNRGGSVVAGQALALNAATVDNTAGQLISNQATVAVTATQVGNAQGLISGAQSVAVTSTTAPLDNTGGRILSDGSVTLKATGLANIGGTVSALDTTVDAGTHTIDNTKGKLIGSHTLALTDGALINHQGLIATGADLSLDTQGQAFDNSAGQISAGGVLTVKSGVLNNQAGTLASGSAVSITSRALNNVQGQIGATGASSTANLNVASLTNSDGTVSAGTLVLASTGAITNAGGSISAAQDATITAQSLSNTASATPSGQTGQVVAGRDMSLTTTGVLVNNAALIQSGRNAVLNTGTLTNDAGVIDSHGTLDVTSLGAATNVDGVLRTANAAGSTTAGALTLASASLDNSGGTVNAATALTVTTGGLTNANAGLLQSSGGPMTLTATTTNNQHGAIVSAGNLSANTTAFDNAGGAVSAKGKLDLDTHGNPLANNADAAHGASIQAGGTATIKAGVLSNLATAENSAVVAAQDLAINASTATNSGTIAAGGTNGVDGSSSLTTTGAFVNDGGRVQAQGKVTTSSQTLSNQGGKIIAASSTGATAPALSITTSGALNNATQGLIAAVDGDATLNTQGGTFANNKAGTVYAKGALALTTGAADNSQGGSVLSGGALTATTLSLNNDAGSVQGGSVKLNTQGQALTNDHGAIQSAGDVTLATGALSNNAGTVASTAKLAITATGAVDNSAGLMSGTKGLSLTATGQTVTNAGGTIKSAQGDASITADTVNNDAGGIASAGTTTINAATAISNRGVGTSQGQIAGNDVVLTTGTLTNTGGRIAADHDATITTSSTDNTSGETSAKHDVALTAPTLVNTNGQIVANNALTVNTASSSFGGTLSGNDLALNVNGDYTNTSTLSAKNKLALNANNIANSGEISGTTTQVNAAGTLTNSGLIDGTDTSVTASTLANTGRIYGDQLKVGGGAINNSGSGVIAARDSLSLSAQSLSNTGGGLIYAINDISIGGALNGDAVQGSMATLLNASSTIEAGRDLSIAADSLTNRNDALQVGSVTTTKALNDKLIQPDGSTTKYSLDQLGWDSRYENGIGHWVIDSKTYPISVYGLTTKLATHTTTCTTGDSGGDCTTVVNYTPTDPIWTLFKVPPPDYTGLVAPVNPGYGTTPCMTTSGGDSGFLTRDPNGACGAYWNNFDAYTAAVAQRDATAYGALDVQISAFNADVSPRMFDSWNEYQVTERTSTTPVLTSSSPAQLLAGRNLSLQGTDSKTNANSNIVAGATLLVTGSKVNNSGITGTQTDTDTGQVRHRETHYNGNILGTYDEVLGAWSPIVPAPVSNTVTLASYRYEDHAANPTGSQTLTGAAPSGASAGGAGPVSSTAVASASAPTAPGPQTISTDPVSAATSQAVVIGTVNAGGVAGTGATSAVTVNPAVGPISVAAIPVGLRGPGSVTATGAAAAPVGAASSATSVPTVQRYAVTGSDQKARDVILTVAPRLTLPTSSLFRVNAQPGASYLVETDPRFTQYRNFLGSDYFEQRLGMDPSRTLKRYGDGFEEQQLVNDQVLALTGRRYLTGYQSTEDEFKALMDSGVAYAKQYQLTPGVALTAEQMALLTTDIVWLTTQTVTLADGSTQQVLVPQVYIRRPQNQDLTMSGALMAGGDVLIQAPSDLVNSGTIQGDRVTLLSDADLVNQGTVSGADIYARASNDLKNIGGSFIGAGANSIVSLNAGRDIVLQTTTLGSSNADGSSTRTNIDRIATVQGGTITLDAARDLIAQGAVVAATGDLSATAAREIKVSAVEGSYQINTATGGRVEGPNGIHTGHIAETSTTNQVSNFSAGNNLALVAQGDVSLVGANLGAGNNAYVQGVNVTVAAAKDRQTADVQNVGQHGYNGASSNDEFLAGGGIQAGNNLTLVATGKIGADGKPVVGTGNLNITGAALKAGTTDGAVGQAILVANNDVTIKNATTEHTTSSESFDATSHWWGSSTGSTNESSHTTQVEGSTISAGSLIVKAGSKDTLTGNVLIQGSQVVAGNDVRISAGKDLTIKAAEQTSSMQSSMSSQKGGLFAGDDGASFTIGHQKQSQDGNVGTTTHVGSQVGSLNGNVSLSAGNQYTQTASEVIAPGSKNANGTVTSGDIDISAKKVLINSATDTVNSSQSSRFDQSGVSVAVGSPIITAAQGAARMSDAADKTTDPRLKALAAASAALGAANAVTATQAAAASGDPSAGMSVTITYQDSHSKSDSLQTGNQAVGSMVGAGRNLSIRAEGAVADSSVTVVGSKLSAGNDATLKAEGKIDLSAAQSTTTQKETNSSNSAGAGVALSYDTGGGGIGVGYTANASGARGHSDGTDVTQTNTTIKAGRTVSLTSGSDTNLNGAVVSGNAVKADIGGNLNIQSLQDTTTLNSKQQGAGASGTYGYGSSVSASVTDAKVDGDFASVTQQSGLKAGDGGFQVNVKGNTDLKGGTIASSQAAIDNKANSLTTATITTSDIANHDQYSASGLSLAYGSSGGSSAGIGHESGSQSSVTKSGVSQGSLTITDSAAQSALTGKSADQTIASLNRDVTSNKDSGVIAKSWNGSQLMDSVQASTQITAAFGANASKALGDFAASKTKPYSDAQAFLVLNAMPSESLSTDDARALNQLRASGMTQESAQATANDPQVKSDYETWKEGGVVRNTLHAVIGGLTGGIAGAFGAGASSAAAPTLNELQNSLADGLQQAGVNPGVAAGIARLAGTATTAGLGAAVGGAGGAATAFNGDTNNRQLHPQEIDWIGKNASKFAKQLSDALGRPVNDLEAMQWLTSAGESDVDAAMQRSNGNFVRGTSNSQDAQAYDAAKAFIATQAKGSFTDESGQNQQLFTAKNGDFYKPEIYSQYANNKAYRDYFWTVQGLNLKPDNPTPQEQATYDQRQSQVDAAKVKQLIVAGAVMAGAAAAVKANNYLTATDPNAPVVLTGRDIDAQRIENNVTRDGGIADPSKPLSAMGNWKPAAAITPAEATAMIVDAVPAGMKVTGAQSADILNAAAKRASNYSPPFLPGTQVLEVTTTQPTQMVRVYVENPDPTKPTGQAGGWVMRAEDIQGLTPQQIASKYGLPEVPTMMTDVSIPVGTKLGASVANGISPFANSTGTRTGDNGGGGGVQFQLLDRLPADSFTNKRLLPKG